MTNEENLQLVVGIGFLITLVAVLVMLVSLKKLVTRSTSLVNWMEGPEKLKR